MNPLMDHLFVIAIRKQIMGDSFVWNSKHRVILEYKMWKAAANVIAQYNETLQKSGVDYTTAILLSEDSRQLIFNFVKVYQIDSVYIGEHKETNQKYYQKYCKPFESFCQNNLNCTVIVC